MRAAAPLLTLAALWPCPAAAVSSATPGDFDVLGYEADLRVETAEQRISGTVTVELAGVAETLADVELDAHGMEILEVREAEQAIPFEYRDERLRIPLEPPAHPGQIRRLEVRYTAKPGRGASFGDETVFAFFHTSHWLVCRDELRDKAALTLHITVPAGLEVVANGLPEEPEPLAGGLVRHTWHQRHPYPSYLFGFAAGRFAEATERAGDTELRFLGRGFTPEQLRRIFASARDALRWLEERAGVPYPEERFTWVLLDGAPAQEMGGLTLLSSRYGASVLEDPREDYLVVHELAHQWWGNLVTLESWSELWLNEGLVTFLTAAFKEHFWGREEYEREITLARLRSDRVRRGELAGRALVFTGWSEPGEMGNSVTYSYGALVFHFLRFQLGEDAFWDGLRRYTRAGAGATVTSEDLRRAMETASGRDLRAFFDCWVYSGDTPELEVRHHLSGDPDRPTVVFEIERLHGGRCAVPLQVAVETGEGRTSRRVTLDADRLTVRLEAPGPPLSIRVDDGGHLPMTVAHPRPVPMLLHQMAHEPDVAGRTGALLQLVEICEPAARSRQENPEEPVCAQLTQALSEAARSNTFRLVRRLAGRSLERLAPDPEPAPNP